jgi:homoserine O-succinyltransferase
MAQSLQRISAATRPLTVGLVNSMPGEARRHTERQFRAILAAAAGEASVELRLFSLGAAVLGGEEAAGYDDTAMLEAAGLDGLIVTGMPPRAAALADEPYWGKFRDVVDLAVDRAIPTVWSCLAAHAAVLRLDGVERRRLPEKLSGLFACERTEAEHPILAGLPRRWLVPQSRHNDLPEADLRAAGYRVLARSAEAGADLFVKEAGAPFLFCQGHPEYDAGALAREYRRDVRQFLAGERDDYPAMPRHYFTPEAAAALEAFRARAERARTPRTLADFPAEAAPPHSWHGLTVGLYGNWLAQVAARPARRGRRWPARAAVSMS